VFQLRDLQWSSKSLYNEAWNCQDLFGIKRILDWINFLNQYIEI
jgi:hypothetical protein